MKDCKSLLGYIFGHKFEVLASLQNVASSNPNGYSSKVTREIMCKRCGLIISQEQ